MALIKAYSAMLPRLEAGERKARISDAMVTARMGLSERDATRLLDDLDRAEAGTAASRPRGKPATPQMLAAMGIGIRSQQTPPQEAPASV